MERGFPGGKQLHAVSKGVADFPRIDGLPEIQQILPRFPASEWPGGFTPIQRSSAGWLAG